MVRIELASFAGHPGDMALFAYSSRLYFETGRFDTLFPTLPLVYYVQLFFYSLYVLVIDAGFRDLVFLNHPFYMIEGLFLRIPLIISDVAIFAALLRYTGKLRYAALFFLNPFTIYLSSAWGTYDTLMILPLVVGFLLLSRNQQRLASISFVISGLFKLFGFVPFGLLALDNLVGRRFKEAAIQLGIASALTLATFVPYFGSGLQDFYVGFVLRFLGLSGARTRVYNLFAAMTGVRFGGSSPLLYVVAGIPIALFLVQRRKSESLVNPILSSSIVAAAALVVFSQSEPQWISWLIPLSILYAFLTRREGLAGFSYFLGTISTFLSITLLQTTSYLVTGTPSILFGTVEGLPGQVIVYSIMVASLLTLLLGYVFLKPVAFKIEIVALTALVYLQAYFWFTIIRVAPV